MEMSELEIISNMMYLVVEIFIRQVTFNFRKNILLLSKLHTLSCSLYVNYLIYSLSYIYIKSISIVCSSKF